jgi:hypothetical protein
MVSETAYLWQIIWKIYESAIRTPLLSPLSKLKVLNTPLGSQYNKKYKCAQFKHNLFYG